MIDLWGYFDEGGTHAQSRVIVLAGHVRPASEWQPFEKDWKQILKEEGAPFYHTTDIEADPPRGIYKDWTRKQADCLTDRLAPLVANLANSAFGAVMQTKDWFAAADFLKHLLARKSHSLPYQILTKHMLGSVVEKVALELPRGERVAFVFEDNDWAGAVRDGYKLFQSSYSHSDRIRHIAFESNKSRCAALQAADMLAWHYRRLNEIRFCWRRQRPHRHAQSLFPKTENGKFQRATEGSLRKILKDAVKNLPSN